MSEEHSTQSPRSKKRMASSPAEPEKSKKITSVTPTSPPGVGFLSMFARSLSGPSATQAAAVPVGMEKTTEKLLIPVQKQPVPTSQMEANHYGNMFSGSPPPMRVWRGPPRGSAASMVVEVSRSLGRVGFA